MSDDHDRRRVIEHAQQRALKVLGIELSKALVDHHEVSPLEQGPCDEQPAALAVSEAIGDQGANLTQHVKYVWLYPGPKGRISPTDAQVFREQLFAFILECDALWPKERYWGVGAVFSAKELAAYPMLAKYLSGIKLHPAREEGKWERNWITFPA
jgi:hypothetical protein